MKSLTLLLVGLITFNPYTSHALRLKVRLPSPRTIINDVLISPAQNIGGGILRTGEKAIENVKNAGGKAEELGQSVLKSPETLGQQINAIPKVGEQFISSVGDDIKTSSEKIGNISCNIYTLGGCSRRKDRERAQQALREANMQNKYAKEKLGMQVAKLKEDLALEREFLAIMRSQKYGLKIVYGVLESTITNLATLLEMSLANQANRDTILRMFQNQNNLVVGALEKYSLSADLNNPSVEAIVKSIESFSDKILQISSLTKGEELSLSLSKTIELGQKAAFIVDKAIATIEVNLSDKESEIQSIEADLKTLENNQ